MSPLLALSTAWRQYRPRPDPLAGSRALVAALEAGVALGEALQQTAAALARASVHQAAGRFEGGVLALFIVDVRDALEEQLLQAAREVKDAHLGASLRTAARAVHGDTFVQHLINALLGATGLYTESQVLERLDERRCHEAVSALFTRSLCVLITRSDAARSLGTRSRRVEFIPLPQPSRPTWG